MPRGRPPNLPCNEARAAGLKIYSATNACDLCGGSACYVSNGQCVECTIAAAKARYRSLDPEALAALKSKDKERYARRLLRDE